MSDHISIVMLNALASGELAPVELAAVTEHLRGCPLCTSLALETSLLKTATARAGQRYAPPDDLRERMERLMSLSNASSDVARRADSPSRPENRPPMHVARWMGWAVAATLLIAITSAALINVYGRRVQSSAIQSAVLSTEMRDQHIATLADNSPPQVLSSDRHTVKPWFQGKISFSFNLPQKLPDDVKLEGANLTYLRNHPAAQLIYSIGRHRASVFVQEKTSSTMPFPPKEENSGFGLTGFSVNGIDVVAISDVDPVRLKELINLIEQAQ